MLPGSPAPELWEWGECLGQKVAALATCSARQRTNSDTWLESEDFCRLGTRLNPFQRRWLNLSLAVRQRGPAEAPAIITWQSFLSMEWLALKPGQLQEGLGWIQARKKRVQASTSFLNTVDLAKVVSIGKPDSSHLPLGRGRFHCQAADVSAEDEALIKQCLYFLCIFLCSKKSTNVFSCWIQRRDCPGKTAAPLEGQLGREILPLLPLSTKLRAGLPEPGQALWLRWFLIKAISIQRMCTQTQPKSMKPREKTETKM